MVMNSALLLAELIDADSILALSERLPHPSSNVARAASRSLAYLGSVEITAKGPVVRALVASLPHVDPRAVRPYVFQDLQRLAGRTTGTTSSCGSSTRTACPSCGRALPSREDAIELDRPL